MTCDEVQQLLPAYVTGALEPPQSASVHAHLLTCCPECVQAVRETKAAFELFTETLVPMEPSPKIKEKLMVAVGHKEPSVVAPARGMRILRYAMAACIGVMLGGIYLLLMANRELTASLVDRDARIDQLNALVGASNLNLVELTGQKSTAHGHILYDPANHRWRIYIFNLEPPPINHVYELWAITADSKKLPAGTFTVDAHGNAVYTGAVPENVVAAAITDEPIPGTSAPTGTIRLLGKISG